MSENDDLMDWKLHLLFAFFLIQTRLFYSSLLPIFPRCSAINTLQERE